MLGFIVELIWADLTNLPLNPSGLEEHTAFMAEFAFSKSCSEEKEHFPINTAMAPVLSILKSTLPDLTSLIASSRLSVTVPALGVGISPLGPKTRAIDLTDFIAEVVEIATSKSVQPSLILVIRSSSPA